MTKDARTSGGSQSQFLLYQTEDGQTRIEVRLEDETLWMTQAMMAELFQTTPQNIILHLKAVYSEGGLDEAATCKDYLQVQNEGNPSNILAVRNLRTTAEVTG